MEFLYLALYIFSTSAEGFLSPHFLCSFSPRTTCKEFYTNANFFLFKCNGYVERRRVDTGSFRAAMGAVHRREFKGWNVGRTLRELAKERQRGTDRARLLWNFNKLITSVMCDGTGVNGYATCTPLSKISLLTSSRFQKRLTRLPRFFLQDYFHIIFLKVGVPRSTAFFLLYVALTLSSFPFFVYHFIRNPICCDPKWNWNWIERRNECVMKRNNDLFLFLPESPRIKLREYLLCYGIIDYLLQKVTRKTTATAIILFHLPLAVSPSILAFPRCLNFLPWRCVYIFIIPPCFAHLFLANNAQSWYGREEECK